MSESLNEFLATVATSGQVESEGVFTLDADKARSKLAAFQLADPYLYAAHLVSTAVLSGASYLNVARDGVSITFDYDGQGYDGSQLHSLMRHLLEGSDRRLQELAIALAGAMATKPEQLLFQSQAYQLVLQDDELQLEEVPALDRSGSRLTLRYPITMSRLTGLFDRSFPEKDVLSKFCARAPIAVKAGMNHLSSRDFAPQGFLAWKYWKSRQSPWRVIRPSFGVVEEREWEQPFGLVLTLVNPMFSEVQGFNIVLNGIQFRRPGSVLGCPYACGVLYAAHLTKNVSHTDLVEDQAYQEMMKVVRGCVDELWEDLARSSQTPGGNRSQLVLYLKGRFKSGRSEAMELLITRLDLDQKLAGGRSEEFLQEARQLEDEGNPERARMIREKVLDSLNRSLVADFPKKLSSKTVAASRLRERVLAELDDKPDGAAEPARKAAELSRCLSVLVGQKVSSSPSGAFDYWGRVRWALCAMLQGEFEAAEAELEALRNVELPLSDFPLWRDFLLAELKGDLLLYARAAAIGRASFFTHEAAAAHYAAGEFEKGFEFRRQAVQRDGGLFLGLAAKEGMGKVGFISLLPIQIRSHFLSVEKRLARLENSFRRHEITPEHAEEALASYAPGSDEFIYLSHVLIWSWRDRGALRHGPELLGRALRLRARMLLLSAFSWGPEGLYLVDGLKA